jgi:nucleoside-diphosphate-sugar epimerase
MTVASFQRSAAPDLEKLGVEVIRGDLANVAQVRAAVRGCGAVFHVAAKAGVWGSRESFFEANLRGTENIVAACREEGVQTLVYTSTPSVVFSGQSFAGEDESLPYGRNWLCHYAESKAEAEKVALAADQPGRLRVCALRPHLIWGIGDPHLLPRVIDRARSGRLRIVGDGLNRVDITHVENAAEAHLQAFDALLESACRPGGKAYFLSQGEPVALWPWINELLAGIGVVPIKRRISLRAAYRVGAVAEGLWRILCLSGEPPMTRFVATELAKDHWYSIAAARQDFGYTPERHPTSERLAEYIEHLREKPVSGATG